MNVLVLAPQPFFANRGTPIAVRSLVEALSADGHAVDLLTYHAGTDVAIANVHHVRARRPVFVREVPIGPSWQKALCDVSLLAAALGMLRRRRYDVVHAVEESAFMTLAFRKLFRVPYVFDMDSLMSEQLRSKGRHLAPVASLFERLERSAIRSAAGVVAVCPAIVDVALAHHPTGNVSLLPDIPQTGVAGGALPEALTSATGMRFMYVGNLEPYQGIGLMLDGFREVAERHPEAVLLIVGGAARDIARYRQRVAELSAAGRVRFVGPCPVEMLAAVLEHADIVLSPRFGGTNTPMKIYSYLQSGKPIVATRLTTHTQVLDDDVACLVDPTPAAFAAGMQALIDSPERRAALAARGRAYVEAEFSERRYRERLRAFYATLRSRS